MMESIVRAQTGDLMSIQWTIYVNQYFEREAGWVVDMSVPEVVSSYCDYRMYYYAGGQRIAEDYYPGGIPVHYSLITDHLGSQSVTVNVNGAFYNEMRYTAFGETRYTSGSETLTDRLYTGQRLEEELGLYYYNARFYDPVLGHFVQADTILSNPGFALAYDRYAYVTNNPVRYYDPSGHMRSPEDSLYPGQTDGNTNSSDLPYTPPPPNADLPTINDPKPDLVPDVDITQLTLPEANFTTNSGGINMWSLFLKLYFYNNRNFTITDFVFLLFYIEGTTTLSNNGQNLVANYGTLNAVWAEAGVRSLNMNYPYTIEGIFNWIAAFSDSMTNAGQALGNGNQGDDIKNQFYNGTYSPTNAKIVTYSFFNPNQNWLSGCISNRPCGWGNDTKGWLNVAPAGYVIYYSPPSFFIPSFDGSNAYSNFRP